MLYGNRRLIVIVGLALVGGTLLLWTIRHMASSRNIEIVEAEYGVPGRTCTAGSEIKKDASQACGGFRPRCLVSVSNGWCGDPAPGAVKTLTVDYMCGATRKRASAAEGTGLVLKLSLNCRQGTEAHLTFRAACTRRSSARWHRLRGRDGRSCAGRPVAATPGGGVARARAAGS